MSARNATNPELRFGLLDSQERQRRTHKWRRQNLVTGSTLLLGVRYKTNMVSSSNACQRCSFVGQPPSANGDLVPPQLISCTPQGRTRHVAAHGCNSTQATRTWRRPRLRKELPRHRHCARSAASHCFQASQEKKLHELLAEEYGVQGKWVVLEPGDALLK